VKGSADSDQPPPSWRPALHRPFEVLDPRCLRWHALGMRRVNAKTGRFYSGKSSELTLNAARQPALSFSAA
jgi:hypothetical protein